MSGTRREFLKWSLATGVAAGLGRSAMAANAAAGTDKMRRRTLGRTKESVTILGLGCAYAGSGISEAETRKIIEAALEGGVRYFDAAPEYEKAEERLGPVVRPVRDEVFLTTKSYALDANGAERDLATALKQLKADHVDLFLQHGVGLKPLETNRQILGKGGSLEFLRKAKREGLTRYIGLSAHPPYAAAVELLEESQEWDVIQPFINYVAFAQEKKKEEEHRLFSLARRSNLGIVAMKVLGGYPGVLAKDYDRAFRYALSLPGVACALIGTRSVEEVKRAVAAAKAFRPLTDAEMKETMQIGEELVRSRSSIVATLNRHMREDFGSTHRT